MVYLLCPLFLGCLLLICFKLNTSNHYMLLLYHEYDTTAIKIRNYNHMGKCAFIVTQSIKKLKAEDKEWALNPVGFKRVSDGKNVDISTLSDDDTGLYYKEEPYTHHKCYI